MAKVNAKNTNNKNLVMVIVLLVILLVAAVVTNDRARKFLTNSSAAGRRCVDIGDATTRNNCIANEKIERSLDNPLLGGMPNNSNNMNIIRQIQGAFNNFLNQGGFKGGKTLTNPIR